MKDWRGVPVEAGDQVIYALHTGELRVGATRRSSNMTIVEGVVLEVEGDSAKVEVLRSSSGWRAWAKPVWVGGSYLTVVTGLPGATSEPA